MRMKIEKEEDIILFLRYALPCAKDSMVKRGVLSVVQLDNAIKLVAQNKIPPGNIEQKFVVANMMCNYVAKRMNKNSIDAEVIRTYFLLEHNHVVETRVAEGMAPKDFVPEVCKTHHGVVLHVEDNHALVKTALGEKEYKADFVNHLKKGDNVAVHFNFIAEKITEDMIKRMQGIDHSTKRSRSKSV